MAELDAFDYPLPPEHIAQYPAEPRDGARLLVLDRVSGERQDARVSDLGRFLRPGDCLVVNDTRVLPSRLLGTLAGADREVELLVLDEPEPGRCQALARPARRLRTGTRVSLAEGTAPATVTGVGEGGRRDLTLDGPGTFRALLTTHGLPPLPPYIRRYRKPVGDDRARYQTVYARRDGAIAAPTAGLHFTPGLLAALAGQGVARHAVTLHVGPGTFQPVRAARVADHRVEAERFEVPAATARAVAEACRTRRRVVAVGTTTVRALETAAPVEGKAGAVSGRTELTITPGYRFQVVDALLTNFHLPRSSLLMLVAAFAGREPLLDAYRYAIARGYRFYSYGDAMLIL